MKKIKIEVVGPEEDYTSYTCYLWLLEIKDLIEEDFNIRVEIKWEKNVETVSSYDYFPVLLIEGRKVFVGLPSEAGFLYEIIRSFLIREMKLNP